MRRHQWILMLMALAACTDTLSPPNATVHLAAADPIPGMVLGARLSGRATGFDSVRARLWAAGVPTVTTPGQPAADSLSILALGLKAATTYWAAIETFGSTGMTRSESLQVTTAALPARLANLHLAVSSGTQSPGYLLVPIFVDSVGYIIAFDTTGQVGWYADLSTVMPNATLGDVEQLGDGRFVAYIGGTSGWQPVPGLLVEINHDGTTGARHYAPVPLYLDNHEIMLDQHRMLDTLNFFAYDIRTLDMSAYGGSPTAQVAGHYLVRRDPGDQIAFLWSAWDHFTLADWVEAPASNKALNPTDFDHPNALSRDLDGNYIVSWRNFGEVDKINALTGVIIWRMGGRVNQFTFPNDPLLFFSGEHNVQVLPNGHLIMYDNGLRHTPPESRAVEYSVDPQSFTATMVWQYRHSPALFTPFTGSVQRLANGNTLIGWAGLGMVTEVTNGGSVTWEGQVTYKGQALSLYRLRRIASLYTYIAP